MSAPSTLAQSILNNPNCVGLSEIDAIQVEQWIRVNTDGINFLLPLTLGLSALSLMEAFLHARWKPKFEGRSTL
jgi:hypothetical protein